ncbi:MAG: gluconate 2-dehydrogenase subunit 3 family protein [Epsilonproteobacteria bacterium]|nr:gluconate 2-dehydrogenase subunit 3 family protein [Campylobacterota bacterium]
MERRHFIALALLLFSIPLSKNSNVSSWEIIKTTLLQLFPQSDNFAGANNYEIIKFLKTASSSKYFQKDDLQILIDGAKKIYTLDNTFVFLDNEQKEKTLRIFEKTEFGQKWLSILMNYGFEGMFGDPIYGGNKNMLGWKVIGHNAGIPRPKGKYGI